MTKRKRKVEAKVTKKVKAGNTEIVKTVETEQPASESNPETIN